ncbi:MAG: hypothetical protein ACLSDQ_13970 [Adlercreutzia equolifaciens]
MGIYLFCYDPVLEPELRDAVSRLVRDSRTVRCRAASLSATSTTCCSPSATSAG